MPVYRITTRDGRKFDVTLREGVTPEQALPELESMVASMPPVEEERRQPKRPSTEDVNVFRDVPGALVSGVGSLIGLPANIYGLVTGDFDTWLGKTSGAVSRYGQEMKSPGLQERERLAGEKIEQASGRGIGAEVSTALQQYLTDPRLLLSGVTETVPSLVGSLGAGTAAKLGVKGALRLAGREATEKAAQRAAVSGAVGFGSTQQGADVGAQTYISAMETPDNVWAQNTTYANRVAAGEDPTAVKEDMALSAAREAALIGGGVSLATAAALPGVEKMILGPGVSGGLLRRGLKGAGFEGFQEGLEEGGGQFAQNVGLQTVDPTLDLGSGVAGAATVGAILGAGMGAPVAALNREPEAFLGTGGPRSGAPPPPLTTPPPGGPPSEGLLGALGTPGGTVYLREGDGEAPYIYRGVDDTGRILIEDEGGNIFAEDPSDLEGAVIRSEPPAAAPEPPEVEPPVTEPPAAEPPVVEPPLAEPPVEQPLAEPPVVEPPVEQPLPEPPAVEPPPAPPAPPSSPPVAKPFKPMQPPAAPLGPLIEDTETLEFWKANLPKQKDILQKRRDHLNFEFTQLQQSSGSLSPEEFALKRDALTSEIDDISKQIATVDEDIAGVEQGVAPIPRPRPLSLSIAQIVKTPNKELAEAVRNKTAVGVMDWLSQNASTDFHREVAKRIGNLMKAMENAGFQFDWGVYNSGFQPKDMAERQNYEDVLNDPDTRGSAWVASQEFGPTLGAGHPNSKLGFDRYIVGVKDWDLPNSGANEVTILHEFAHVVTSAAMAQLDRGNISPNSRVGQAVKELKNLKSSAVKFKNKILKDIADGKAVDRRLAGAIRRLEGSNAWDNEKELIVQGLSNIDMQVVLKAMPYQKTNGFVEFIRQIGRLIGVSEKDMNGLRRLFELTDELVPTDVAMQEDVIQTIMDPYASTATLLPSGLQRPPPAINVTMKPVKPKAAPAPAPPPPATPAPKPTPKPKVPEKKYTLQPVAGPAKPVDAPRNETDPGYYNPNAIIIDETFFQYGVGKDYLDANNLNDMIDQLLIAGAEIYLRDQDGLFWAKDEGVDKIVGPGFRGKSGNRYSPYFFRPMKAGSLAHPRIEVVLAKPVEITFPGGGKPKFMGKPAPAPSTERIEPQASEGVDEFTLDEDIQQAIYSARKVPSLSRRVDRLVREWRAGRMTDAEFMAEVADWSDYIGDVRQGKAMKRKMKGRARGADYIRQRLLEAKRRGELTEDAADFAEWFIKRNPALVDDLGIAMRQQKGAEEYIGRYNPYGRVMTLLKNSGSDTTAVHEILHHLERMMPEDVQGAIRDSWWNATQKAAKAETKPKAKAFFNAIKSFYMGDPLVDENGKPVLDDNGRAIPPSEAMDVAMDLYNKHLDYDYYEHVSPSEFWAVRATDIVKGRYDVQGSTLGRLKGWLRDAGQYIKGFFGLPSNAPILKALKSLSDSDGKYVSTYMLADLGSEKAPIRDTALGKEAAAPTEPTGPSASALLTPEDEARQITEDAAVEPPKDTAEVLKEAAKPIIKVYNMRSEMQEKSRGCD